MQGRAVHAGLLGASYGWVFEERAMVLSPADL
jgi:hypothetical protein